jgi:hypothetical protein
LQNDGVPTWGSATWGCSSVSFILHNEVYAGVSRFDDIDIAVPALISREAWQLAQGRLNANEYTGRPSTRFLLRGVLYCECGLRMHGESKGRYTAYRCAGRDRSTCRKRAKGGLVDSAAWSALRDVFTDSAAVRARLQAVRESLTETVSLDDLRDRLRKAKRKETAVTMSLMDPDLLDVRADIKAQYRIAAEERRRAEGDLAAAERAQGTSGAEWIEDAVAGVREFMQHATDPTKKQAFVRWLVRRADMKEEAVQMTCFFVPKPSSKLQDSGHFHGLQVVVNARLAA